MAPIIEITITSCSMVILLVNETRIGVELISLWTRYPYLKIFDQSQWLIFQLCILRPMSMFIFSTKLSRTYIMAKRRKGDDLCK
jgi:hypothetical protein